MARPEGADTAAKPHPLLGLIFVASGLLLLGPVLALATGGGAGTVPRLLLFGTILGVSGYRIWRARHPASELRPLLRRRAGSAVGLVLTVIAGLVAQSNPGLVLVIGAVYFALMVLVAISLSRSLR